MENYKDISTDVLIVGTGISGLYAALNLRSDLNILMITKAKIKESNSYLAQGGIAVAKDIDDVPLHIEDTLKAGKYLNDINAVKVLVEESVGDINSLIDYGVEFERENGKLLYTREGAHSINRIVHSKDETGKAVIETLIEKVSRKANITVYEDTCLVDLIQSNNTCYGAVAIRDEEQLNIHSKIVILACGGIGGIFKNSTNQRHLTADGINIAIKNDVKVKNLEYIQFHPTALYENNENVKKFLISESVRGEGGKLRNINGERFVNELLPRDVVTEAILNEMNKTNAPYVYLDVTGLPDDYIVSRFPHIYNQCKIRGFDMTKEYIPVTPAQHYFMGGIEVDLSSKTSMKNLFAVGEVSCTGVHGANRLASNSLLEGLVFSRRAAKNISDNIDNIKLIDIKQPELATDIESVKTDFINMAVDTFSEKVGMMKDELVNS